MKIELHCHTTESDGRLEPKNLGHLAIKENLKVMSLTDHDSVRGHSILKPMMDEANIAYIPGIELTTSKNGESIHILGYFKGDGYKEESLIEKLDELFHSRNHRMMTFTKNLKTHFDLDIDYHKLREANKGVLTRANLALAVQEHFPEENYNDLFVKYLSKDSRAYVPNVKISVDEGIKFLHDYGAIAVLAHPIIYTKNTLEDLLAHDFDGLECYYFLNDTEMTKKSLKAARDHNLLITVGSDYHGIPGEKNHGYIGSMDYNPDDLKTFLDLLLEK